MEAEGGKVTATKGPAGKQGPRPEGRSSRSQRASLVGPAEEGRCGVLTLRRQGKEQGPERGRRNQSGPRTTAVLRGQGGPARGAAELLTEETRSAEQTSIKTEAGRTKTERRGANSSLATQTHIRSNTRENPTLRGGGNGEQRAGKRRGRPSHREGDGTTATQGRQGASRKHAEGQERPPCPPGPAPAASRRQLVHTHHQPQRNNVEQSTDRGSWPGSRWA